MFGAIVGDIAGSTYERCNLKFEWCPIFAHPIIAFLESSDFETAIRKAISIGGDSDTIACIAGSIAHAFYGRIPEWMIDYCMGVLDVAQKSIIYDFWERYPYPKART